MVGVQVDREERVVPSMTMREVRAPWMAEAGVVVDGVLVAVAAAVADVAGAAGERAAAGSLTFVGGRARRVTRVARADLHRRGGWGG